MADNDLLSFVRVSIHNGSKLDDTSRSHFLNVDQGQIIPRFGQRDGVSFVEVGENAGSGSRFDPVDAGELERQLIHRGRVFVLCTEDVLIRHHPASSEVPSGALWMILTLDDLKDLTHAF